MNYLNYSDESDIEELKSAPDLSTVLQELVDLNILSKSDLDRISKVAPANTKIPELKQQTEFVDLDALIYPTASKDVLLSGAPPRGLDDSLCPVVSLEAEPASRNELASSVVSLKKGLQVESREPLAELFLQNICSGRSVKTGQDNSVKNNVGCQDNSVKTDQDNFVKLSNILKHSELNSRSRTLVSELYKKQYKRYVTPLKWLKVLEENNLAEKDGNIRLISYIYTKIRTKKFEFTNIQSKHLESFTKDYKKIIEVLSQLVDPKSKLYINNSYSTGVLTNKVDAFTKSYRCFKSNDTDVVYLTITDTSQKRTSDISINSSQDNSVKSDYLKNQQEMFEHVEIDIKSALEYINPQRKDFKSTQRAIKVLEIYKGNLYITQPDNNRLYHSFNCLDSDLRQFLKTKNSTFKTLDIVAAQPSILMTLIDEPSEDTKDLIKLFKTNRIYDTLAEELKEDPESIKTKYMIFTYKFDSDNKVVKYYNKHYPGFIKDINNLRKKLHIKDFWNLISSKETLIMEEVFNQIPGTKISIHDELMVEEQYFEDSKEIFNKVLTKYNIPSRVK